MRPLVKRLLDARTLGIVVALPLAIAACSLIVDTNADPCTSNADCPVPGSVCGPDRICAVPLAVVDAAPPPEEAATVCSDQSCCSAAQCMSIHGGEPYACPRPGQACVPLKSSACTRLLGKPTDPTALVVGILGRGSGSSAALTAQQIDVMELAIDEVNTATLGIPGPAGAPARPIAAVACDELVDTEATHLIDELHVPALITLGTSGFTVALTPKVVATDTFMMCAICGSPAVTTLDDKGLVWRTQPVSADLGKAEAAYFPELEAKVRLANAIASTTPIKVAVVNNKGFQYTAPTENLIADLRYNDGKTPLANGGNFFRIDYDDPSEVPTVDLQAVANQVIAYAPHVIALSGSCELGVSLLPFIEGGWGGSPKPYYITHSGIECPELYTYVAAHPSLSARLRLMDFAAPAESAAAFSSFSLRLKSRFADNDPLANNNVYDGIYAALYAIAAVDPTLPLTGTRIAQQVPRLAPPGTTKVPVGPTDFPNGVSLLRKGGAIDLMGVFTDLNFDSAGDVHGDSAVVCVAPVSTPFDAGAPVYGLFFTNRLYSNATGQLSGTDNCPP